MKGRLIGFLLLLLLSFSLHSQNVEFIESSFPGQKQRLAAAVEELRKGDEFFFETKEGLDYLAIDHYLKAYSFNPDNALLNYKLGACYLNTYMKPTAIPYLEKALKLNPKVDPDIQYLLGEAYHYNYEFDKAIPCYESFKSTFRADLSPHFMKVSLDDAAKQIDKKIGECRNGKHLVENPIRIFIDNLGNVVNSRFPDYNPKISTDESVLLFTSRRDNTTGGGLNPLDFKYNEDILVTYNENGQWTEPKGLSANVNSDQNDGIVAISPDGQEVFLVYGSLSGDIYDSRLYGDKWSRPRKLPATINSGAIESSASISADGRTIYFTSDRPGGYGGADIYMSRLNSKGEWGEAVNLGPVVNSPYNEESVFIHPDGKTLYFSSEGFNSMGGYDVFKSMNLNGQWTKPENLGYPVNTPDNDIFYTISANGKHAYYSTEKTGGFGGQDIYMITFLGPEKQLISNTEDIPLASLVTPLPEKVIEQPIAIRTNQLTILKGTVFDADDSKPMQATIEVTDNQTGELLASFTSNSMTGKYLLSLPSGKNYGIAFHEKGYLFVSENMNIPEDAPFQEVYKNIFLLRVRKAGQLEALLDERLGKEMFRIELSDKGKQSIDNITGEILPDYEEFIAKDLSQVIETNKDKIGNLFNAGMGLEELVTNISENISRQAGAVDNSGNPVVSPGLESLTRQKLSAIARENTGNNVFFINLEKSSLETLRKSMGKMLPRSAENLSLNITRILEENKDLIDGMLFGGLSLNTLETMLSQEILKNASGSKEQPDASIADELEVLVDRLVKSKTSVPEQKNLLAADLFQITRDAINDTTGKVEIPLNLEGAVKKNLHDLIIRNKDQVQGLLLSGQTREKIRSLLAEEIARAGGAVDVQGRPVVTSQLKALVDEAFEKAMSEFKGKSLFYVDLSPMVRKSIHELEVKQDTGLAQGLRPGIQAIINDNKLKINDLISGGLSIDEIVENLTTEIAKEAGLADQEGKATESKVLRGLVEEGISKFTDDLVGNKLFRVYLYQSTKNTLNKASGTIPPDGKEGVSANIEDIISQNREEIGRLFGAGIKPDELTGILTNEIMRAAGLAEEKKSKFLQDEVSSIVRIYLEKLSAQLLTEKNIFRLPLNESTKEAIDDRTGKIEPARQSVVRDNLLSVISDNKDKISGMMLNGASTETIAKAITSEIARAAGAINPAGKPIVSRDLLEMVTKILESQAQEFREGQKIVVVPGKELAEAIEPYSCKILPGFEKTAQAEITKIVGDNRNKIIGMVKAGMKADIVTDLISKEIALRYCKPDKDNDFRVGEEIKNMLRQYIREILSGAAEEVREKDLKIVLHNIFFEFNSSDLKKESTTELNRLADILNEFTTLRIEISGHTDIIGSDDYNQKLSERRAASVVNYLISKGINKDRMVSVGYGKTRPIAPNTLPDESDYPEGRALNRRTEFKILKSR